MVVSTAVARCITPNRVKLSSRTAPLQSTSKAASAAAVCMLTYAAWILCDALQGYAAQTSMQADRVKL